MAGYTGTAPECQGKVLRLAKTTSTKRFRGTVAGHPAIAYNSFVQALAVPRLGDAVDPGRVVSVTPEFMQEVAAAMDKARPQFRVAEAQLDVESPFQLLMADATALPGKGPEETVSVELKLKWGWTPPPTDGTHWLKAVVSRFAMLQYLKQVAKHVQPQHAAACRSTLFLELHMGVLKHAAACRSIHFFAFMCLSALLFSLSDDHALLAMLSERSV